MLAARWHGTGDVRVEDVPEPDSPRQGQVLIAVESAGICGTDVEEWLHGPITIPTAPHPLSGRSAPLTLGHEVAGRVAASGRGTSLPVGTLVAVEVNSSCGACWWCTHGQQQLCPSLSSQGLMDDGGLARRMIADEARCCPLPDGTDPVVAALVEPLAVAVRACRRAPVGLGDTVAVVGGGTIGQLAAYVAERASARVVLVEPLAARREVAGSLGAAIAVPPSEAPALVADLTAGRGADVTVECAGTPPAVRSAAALTRRGGAIVLVGLGTSPLPLSALSLIMAEHSLAGVLSHVMDDFTTAADLLRAGEARLRALVTDVIPLEDTVTRGLQALRDDPADHLKIIVSPAMAPKAAGDGA